MSAIPELSALKEILYGLLPWAARIRVRPQNEGGALEVKSAAGRTEIEGGGPAALRVGDGGRLAFDPTVPTLYYSPDSSSSYVIVATTIGPPAQDFVGTQVAPTGSRKVFLG
jgi:hypothetical protein